MTAEPLETTVLDKGVISAVCLILTVIAFVRRRTTFIYPLTAIVLSGIAWWVGYTFLIT